VARTGDTYSSKRKPSHMAPEAARLREIVQEREEEIEQLRSTLRTVRRGLDGIASATDEATTREDAVQGISEIDRALDGGGGQS